MATAGFNGQDVFPDLDTYRRAELDLQSGLNGAQIAASGDGPTQFSIAAGTPSASITTGDLGVYAEGEWKASSDLTFDYGIRVESQSAIPDHFDLAPRLGFSYSVKPKKAKVPLVVVRGGFGIFYQRFASSDLLRAVRQNGFTEQVYYVPEPRLLRLRHYTPPVSSLTSTLPTIYDVNTHLRSPMQMQGLITAEHSFCKLGTLAANYFRRRTTHQFESLNINAPLLGRGVRPLGSSQNVYEYSSDGISNGYTMATNFSIDHRTGAAGPSMRRCSRTSTFPRCRKICGCNCARSSST